MKLTVVLLIAVTISHAQEILTLEKAIDLAIEQNHTILAGRHDRESAAWGLKNSYSNFLPKVEISGGLTRIDPETEARANASLEFIRTSADFLGIPRPALADLRPFAYRDTYSTDITVVQPIYNGGAEIAGLSAASVLEERSQYSLDDAEQAVISDVKIAYYNVLKAGALLNLSTESAARTRRWLEMTERRANLGERTNTDVLRFRVQLASEEGNIVNAENGLEMARTRLNELTGEDLHKTYKLEEKISLDSASATKGAAPPVQFASLDPSVAGVTDDTFLGKHPSMKVMDANVRLAEAGVSQAWTRFRPRVNLAFQYGWEKNNTLALDGIRPWALAFSVSWPIFNSFGDYANLQRAEAEAGKAREQGESFRRGLLVQATNAELAVRSARKRIEIAAAGVREAEDVLNSVVRRYELGAASNVDLIDVQTAFTSAKTNYIAAVYDRSITEVQLARATGVIGR